MDDSKVYSGSPWEKEVGYCRAVRRGNLILVAGTAPVDPDGTTHAPGDAYAQTRRCFEIALGSLQDLGGGVEHVVRTRMYTTDISRWRDYGRAHRELFGENPPVTTMVEVSALIAPDMMIEVELEAVILEG
jgi:enamine deaminase RidA (YjgF/YER057c/UK114 family)